MKLFITENDLAFGTQNNSPSKLAQPRLSINEIIAEKKLKEKRRFIMNPPEERNRSMPELFKVVEEAKRALDEGHITLRECYQMMLSLKESVHTQNTASAKMMKMAEDLLYDAKC